MPNTEPVMNDFDRQSQMSYCSDFFEGCVQKCLLWHRSGRRQIGRFFDRAMSSAIGVSYSTVPLITGIYFPTLVHTVHHKCVPGIDCYTGNYYSIYQYILYFAAYRSRYCTVLQIYVQYYIFRTFVRPTCLKCGESKSIYNL